jgi:hypothetical protein
MEVASMNIEIYRFESWSSLDDKIHRSARWGTAEGIRRIQAQPIETTKVIVDGDNVPFEYEGITYKDFDPSAAPPKPATFPNTVRK